MRVTCTWLDLAFPFLADSLACLTGHGKLVIFVRPVPTWHIMGKWHEVEVRTCCFHKCPAYCKPFESMPGRWGFQSFYYDFFDMQMCRWLRRGGEGRVKIVAGVMCPALPSNLWPSKKVAVMKESPKHSATQATDHGAREIARAQKACFGYLVSTSWLLCFLIVVLGLKTARRQDDEARARKASDLLKDWSLRAVRQHIVLHVPAAADEWILHDGKVMSHDRQLNCLLFAGMEGPHDVLDWLKELSVLL